MKKLLLFCFALSALAFTACEKEESSTENSEYDYTLTISPSSVKLGGDVTLTIKGDGVSDMSWQACFNRVDDGSGSCIMPSFVNGSATINIGSYYSAGEYTFYASSGETKTSYASLTVTE